MTVRVHIIVPTTTKFEFREQNLALAKGAGIELTQSHITNGPASIESEYDEILCAPDTIKEAVKAQNDGADAVVIICMGDPALVAVREKLDIPVFGIGQVAMHHAALLGHKFSILPTLDRRIPFYETKATTYGLSHNLASVVPTGISVLAIDHNPDATLKVLIEKALIAINDGADTIVLGCGCFQDVDKKMMEKLEELGHSVQVLDAIPLAILHAGATATLGLCHSKKAFPTPPEKKITGYDIPEIE